MFYTASQLFWNHGWIGHDGYYKQRQTEELLIN